MSYSTSIAGRTVIVAVALILTAGSITLAQQRGDRPQRPAFDAEQYIADLDKALDLSDEQVKEMGAIMEQARQRSQGQGRRGGMMGMNRVNEAIEKVLTPEQVTAFREFNFNRMVDQSMQRYIEVLELTDKQQEQIRPLVVENTKEMSAFREQMQGGGDRQAMFERFRASRDALNEKIGAFLTDDQKTAFERMNQRRGGRQRQ